MLTRSHRLCSVALVELGLFASNAFLTNPISNIVILVATGIGASLPDIDEYNSSTSRKSLINFSLFLRHRGITHSLLGWLFFSAGLFFLMNHFMPIQLKAHALPNWWGSLWLGLTIGYFLHLIEDSFSKEGIDWFVPFKKKKFHRSWFHYKVGGWFEKLLTFIAVVSIAIMTACWIFLLASPKI